jgi:DNA helicase HerA-like ATPase
MKLFPKDKVAGIFRGFSEGGLEFHADLVLPYKSEFQSTPMHGQFLVVQLEHEDEAVLGRITSISSQGRLASGAGEDYGIRAVSENRAVPEDLREQYLKYQVDIRVLGVLRKIDGVLEFAASHRRLPHVGSKVAFLSDEVLLEVAGAKIDGADLGFLALGEFIYAAADPRLDKEAWMQTLSPAVVPRFHASHLVSRRTFVFARAGFGKSNLVKLLFSNLYKTDPVVEKRKGRKVPVGTIVFDPDGEYFWPDDKNRPGLCDVLELENKVVVFTNRRGPSDFYNSFVAGGIKLDIRRLRPPDVISIALSPERQDQQNVRKLKGLNDANWRQLVDEIYRNGNSADEELIKHLLNLTGTQEFEVYAARANMTQIVKMLHDPSSQMMDLLIAALKEGKLCVVDVSQMRGTQGLVLSGLILKRIFDHNQEEFTKAAPETIPTIAVVEEAQSVLGSTDSSGEGPYISWVKEGRKYDLGAVLITQQPGSITHEILSQGDNWFIFHLLSAGDLQAVKKANAHFSDDILSALLNEPIPGHGVFWSSAKRKSYPIPLRVLSFEQAVKVRDQDYGLPAADTYALKLRKRFEDALSTSRKAAPATRAAPSGEGGSLAGGAEPLFHEPPVDEPIEVQDGASAHDEPVDALETYVAAAIARLEQNKSVLDRIRKNGIPWMGVQSPLMDALPAEVMDQAERKNIAYANVPRAMSQIFGEGRWKTERRQKVSGEGTTAWIVLVGG